VNKLLPRLIPHVRNGEVTLKTCMGLMRGIINNLVIYSKAGDFYVKFSNLTATPEGLKSHEDELPCWEIIGIEE